MSNWTNNGELCINKDISKLIPADLINGYTIDEIYLTTFSLDLEQLNQVLYGLDALHLISKGKVHVFYDKFSRSISDDSSRIISEEYLHAIELSNNSTLYAFHPKVILCKYIKENGCRYIIVVSSKNISKSNLLDAYAIAYGDVGSNENDSGTQVADFFEIVFSKVEFTDKNLINELKMVSFIQDNKAVEFLTANEVYNTVKNKSNLIVVSPFLSEGFVSQAKGINKIVSTMNGYGKLDDNTIKALINNGKCWLLSSIDSSALHAKIYCYKEGDNTCWIIGSSNATNNGCGINKQSSNIEFNMFFKTESKDYDEFDNLLNGNHFRKLTCLDKDSEDNSFDFRSICNVFLNNIEIGFKYENEQYICEIRALKQFDEYTIKINGNRFDGQLIISGKKPIPSLQIIISDKNNDDAVGKCEISLYNEWSAIDGARNQLNDECKSNYTSLLEHIQNQIISGNSKRSISLGQKRNSTGNVNKRKPVNKTYSFEKILKLAQNSKDKTLFDETLTQVLELSNQILEADINNTEQKHMKELIENLKEAKKQ